jgi:PASTA domain
MTRTLPWLVLPLALAGCAAEDDPASVSSPIIGGQPDTTHLAVGEVFSDTAYCSGTLIGPRLVYTASDCIGANMRFVVHDTDHFDERQVVERIGKFLYLDRPIAHVVPLAYPTRLPVQEKYRASCEIVGFGEERARRSASAIVSLRASVATPSVVEEMDGELEYHGDRGAAVICDGLFEGEVANVTEKQVRRLQNSLLGVNIRPRLDLVAIDSAGTSPTMRSLQSWSGSFVDASVPFTLPPSTPGAWRYGGIGDFNGDRDDDLAWHNTVTGEVRVVFTRVGSPTHSLTQGAIGGTTVIQGVGDFDGDRVADILWRSPSGQMSMWLGGTFAGTVLVGNDHRHRDVPVGFDWAVQGVSDFDGDGRSDILWRHTNGTVAVWYMIGNDRHGTLVIPMNDPTWTWKIEGVADINQNNVGDIIWRDVGGQVVIWFDGSNAGAVVTGVRDHSWSFGGVADINDNGSNDLVWRNAQGQVSAWWMRDHTLLYDAVVTYDDDSARALRLVGAIWERRKRPEIFAVEKPVADVVGEDAATASDLLGGQGFVVVRTTEVDPTCDNIGFVMRTSPGAGTLVPWGGTVNVVEGLRPAICH